MNKGTVVFIAISAVVMAGVVVAIAPICRVGQREYLGWPALTILGATQSASRAEFETLSPVELSQRYGLEHATSDDRGFFDQHISNNPGTPLTRAFMFSSQPVGGRLCAAKIERVSFVDVLRMFRGWRLEINRKEPSLLYGIRPAVSGADYRDISNGTSMCESLSFSNTLFQANDVKSAYRGVIVADSILSAMKNQHQNFSLTCLDAAGNKISGFDNCAPNDVLSLNHIHAILPDSNIRDKSIYDHHDMIVFELIGHPVKYPIKTYLMFIHSEGSASEPTTFRVISVVIRRADIA